MKSMVSLFLTSIDLMHRIATLEEEAKTKDVKLKGRFCYLKW
jgi:hypothetical protein